MYGEYLIAISLVDGMYRLKSIIYVCMYVFGYFVTGFGYFFLRMSANMCFTIVNCDHHHQFNDHLVNDLLG